MKMVKSLLLGSAAGLAAVTAGQAADLPVKAKPVEYVKIAVSTGLVSIICQALTCASKLVAGFAPK